ncbi:MAG: laccase domain-containing protein, partial [Nitriliruptoraceae bacterium]
MPVTVDAVDLGSGVGAWFTRRDPEGAATALAPAGNLSHHRPHSPATLARSRREVAAAIGYEPSRWHQMRQAHGSEVAVVDHRTTPGTELRHVDAAITALNDRPLVVTVADCVPVLLAGQTHVAAVHAGRQGLVAGVLPATVEALARTGEHVASLRAVVATAGKKVELEAIKTLAPDCEKDERSPARALAERSKHADLVVVGNRGLHGSKSP